MAEPEQPEHHPLDPVLAPHAEAIADAIIVLQEALRELDLIDEQGGKAHWHLGEDGQITVAIEIPHPDGGPWLTSFDGLGTDTIVATRMKDDGEREHSTLDEFGLPIEWRTAIRPDLN
jgi:hypothetical protein